MGQHHSTPSPAPASSAQPASTRPPHLQQHRATSSRDSIFQSLRSVRRVSHSPSPAPSPPQSVTPSSVPEDAPDEHSPSGGRKKRKLGEMFRSRRKRARVGVRSGLGVEMDASGEQDDAETEREREMDTATEALPELVPITPPSERDESVTDREEPSSPSSVPTLPPSASSDRPIAVSDRPIQQLISQAIQTISAANPPADTPSVADEATTSIQPAPQSPSSIDIQPDERQRVQQLIQETLSNLAEPLRNLSSLADPSPAPIPAPALVPAPAQQQQQPTAIPILPPIPQGTTMIVQGLVQTSAHARTAPSGDTSSQPSDGSAPVSTALVRDRPPSPSPSVEEQANMLSTLLSVATAATAASLVSGSSNPSSSTASPPLSAHGPTASLSPAPAPSNTLFSPPVSAQPNTAGSTSPAALRAMLDGLRERLRAPPSTTSPSGAIPNVPFRPSPLSQQASLLSSQHASLASELASLNSQMQRISEQMHSARDRLASSTDSPNTADGRTPLREDLASELTRRLAAAAGAGEAARRGLEEAERRIGELERGLAARRARRDAATAGLAEAANALGTLGSNMGAGGTSALQAGQRAREILVDALTAAASHPVGGSHRGSPPSGVQHHQPQQQSQQQFPSALAALPAWTASRQPTPPQEGTFERFLWELQVDLRALLTGTGARVGPGSGANSTPASTAATVSPAITTSPATPIDTDGSQSSSLRSTAATPAEGELTPLAPPPPPPPTTMGGSDVDGERLNWWRMYRFPARIIGAGEAGSDGGSAARERPQSQASTQGSPHSAVGAGADREATAENAAEEETVIPVILVGLRSVTPGNPAPAFFDFPPDSPTTTAQAGSSLNSGSAAGSAPTSPASEPVGLERWVSHEDGEEGHASSASPATASASGSANPINGTWSRAARLLGRLGGGAQRDRTPRSRERERERQPDQAASRSAATGTTTPVEAPTGTRSYIIWVVGGHYPPNHPILTAPHLLTGQLDHDDLWALAELLGQVKPPTATRADIERSGLEVISCDKITEYVREGKVKANCEERCLICLGDYEADEDIRILTCKHAFHQACVDRWLEVGKNNCPACRTKGVPTQDSTTPAAESETADTSASAVPAPAPSASEA